MSSCCTPEGGCRTSRAVEGATATVAAGDGCAAVRKVALIGATVEESGYDGAWRRATRTQVSAPTAAPSAR